MGHETTDPAHIELMMEQSAAHGFEPFHVKSQSMGYLYNRFVDDDADKAARQRDPSKLTEKKKPSRIWAAIKRESLLAAAEGAGTPAEIDAIFRGILKTPKGPFEQMDVVGLDVVHDIEQHYADERQDIPGQPREYLKRYLDRGDLGVKTGRGFYDYGDGSKPC